jgi:putative Mn2+ efflux pump MntP
MVTKNLIGGIALIVIGIYLIFEIFTNWGFFWSSENLTPEQIPAFETASIVVLMISIGMLPVGGFLIGKSKKDKKKDTIPPKK